MNYKKIFCCAISAVFALSAVLTFSGCKKEEAREVKPAKKTESVQKAANKNTDTGKSSQNQSAAVKPAAAPAAPKTNRQQTSGPATPGNIIPALDYIPADADSIVFLNVYNLTGSKLFEDSSVKAEKDL